jgi:hypothetical protein
VQCYGSFADIPPDQLGLTVGSSGFGEDRFLKLAVMGKSAAERLGADVGECVLAPEAFALGITSA